MNKYSISESIRNAYALILTKLFYRGARLIRRPVYMRGRKSISYGKNLTTGYSCRFDLEGKEKTLFIGDNCQMGDNVHIVAHKKVTIGDNCLIASKVFISDTSHGIYDNSENASLPTQNPNDRKLVSEEVTIGDNVWIGENVVILLGTKIGNGCIIGAGSIVTKDIADNCIVAGVPAKVIKVWDNENGWVKCSRKCNLEKEDQ